MSNVSEQWCPICQVQMVYDEATSMYTCPSIGCTYEIDYLDANEYDLGYPTLESTEAYQDEAMERTFERYYDSQPPRNELTEPSWYGD